MAFGAAETERARLLSEWRADIVRFAESCVITHPDEHTGPIVLTERQRRILRAVAETDEHGRPRWKTLGVVHPKRSGKTLDAALALLWKSLWPDRLSVVLSNSREQAQALVFAKCAEVLQKTPELAGMAEVRRNEIEFSNGSRIQVVPCRKATCAGIGVTGLLVSDELWAADDEGAYHVLAGQSESVQGQVLLVSQASGYLSHVYELYKAHEAGADDRLWFDYMTPEECDLGAVAWPSPYMTDEFLASQRAQRGDLYARYYRNEWGVGTQNLFGAAEVDACVMDCETPRQGHELLRVCGQLGTFPGLLRVGCGLDRATPGTVKGDETVWAAVGRFMHEGQDHYVALQADVARGSSESEIVRLAEKGCRLFGRPSRVHVEAYNVSDLTPRLRTAAGHCPVVEVYPTLQQQAGMFGHLYQVVTEGRLHIPADMKRLIEQLRTFQIDTDRDTPRYGGGSGKAVDDYVYGLGHALEAAGVTGGGGGAMVIATSGQPYLAEY